MSTPGPKPPRPADAKTDPERVLIIAADAGETAKALGESDSVTEERFQVESVADLTSGIARLAGGSVGATVLDLNLPGSQGIETLDKIVQAAPDVPVLILSEADTEATARQAVQRGAQDYLVKQQTDGYRLRRTVRTMIDHRAAGEVALENEIARATLDSIGSGILRSDTQGNVTYLNRRAEHLTGWFLEEALGRPVAEVFRLVDIANGEPVANAVEVILQDDRPEVPTLSRSSRSIQPPMS
jgi:DNA-binding NarL/FixJ family response regulator